MITAMCILVAILVVLSLAPLIIRGAILFGASMCVIGAFALYVILLPLLAIHNTHRKWARKRAWERRRQVRS